jgi:hypothetical protein
MNYLHTSRVEWVARSEWLDSGGDHLCTDGSPAAAATSAPSGLLAVATTSAPDSLSSGVDHLSVRAMTKRPSPSPSYGGEDKTIQARELGARRQAVLAVWPGPRTRSSPPSQGW